MSANPLAVLTPEQQAAYRAANNLPEPQASRAVLETVGDPRQYPVPQWLWKGFMLKGAFHICEGRSSTAKSTVMLDIAARITRGEVLPGDDRLRLDGPRDVLIIAPEDAMSVLAWRFEVADGDPQRLHKLTVEGGGNPIFPDAAAILRDAIDQVNPALIIVDALFSVTGRGDINNDAEVRRMMLPIIEVLEETGTAMVGIRHLTKATTGDATTAGLGGVGWAAVARTTFTVGYETSDDSESAPRAIAVALTNMSGKPSLGFKTVDATPPELANEDVTVARVEWLGTSDKTAHGLVAPVDRTTPKKPNNGHAARAWLLRKLTAGATMPKLDLVDLWQDERDGAVRTLERAFKDLDGRRDGALWSLPDSAYVEHDDDLVPDI